MVITYILQKYRDKESLIEVAYLNIFWGRGGWNIFFQVKFANLKEFLKNNNVVSSLW